MAENNKLTPEQKEMAERIARRWAEHPESLDKLRERLESGEVAEDWPDEQKEGAGT